MSHTPRGPRKAGRGGRPGTFPPVPGRPTPQALDRTPLIRRLRGLLCLLCLLALTAVTWQIVSDGPLRAADERLGAAMRAAAPPTGLGEPLADLGNMPVALPLLAVAMAVSVLRTRCWWPAVCYALAMGVTAAVVSALKAWTAREGPAGGTGFYPSGHAATTAVALGGAALLLAALAPSDAVRTRTLWVTAALTLTLGNGLGLVWRAYHWPLDVLASWCVAVLLLTAAYEAARRAPPTRRASGAPAPDGGGR